MDNARLNISNCGNGAGSMPALPPLPQPWNGAYSSLFNTFEDAPAAWSEICGGDDLAMDTQVLGAYQRTLAEHCRCWGLMVYDASGAAIGCAALCLFKTELIQTSHPAVMRWRDWLRRLWPGFGRMPVLFCGMEMPAGSTHIRVRKGASETLVVAQVEKVMQRLAAQEKCRLMVFKEINPASGLARLLSAGGYIRGAIPPLHVLHVSFKRFSEYRDALKSRYRAQVVRSQKKMAAAGFRVVSGRGPGFFAAHFTEEAYRLYVEVYRRAGNKLERMPMTFFHAMAAALGEDAFLTLIYRNGKVCAFTFSMRRGGVHYNTYSGMDYALNPEGDLYFNLFYQDMDQALRAGATTLHLGQTSDSFKSRLGAETEELCYFCRGRSSFFTALLRLAAPFMSPRVEPVTPHHVFTR